ncbi:MAG: hypothetical protein WA988_08480 [Candidatus Nanopelagicales bacterium]
MRRHVLWTGLLVLAASCAPPDSGGADRPAPSAMSSSATSISSESPSPSPTKESTTDPTTTTTTSPTTTVAPPQHGIRFRQKPDSPPGPPPLPPAVPQPNPTAHIDIGAGWEGSAEFATVTCSAHTNVQDAYRGWEFAATNPNGDRLNIKLYSKWANKYGPRRPRYSPEVTIDFNDEDGRLWTIHSSWAGRLDEAGPAVDHTADRGTVSFSGVGVTSPFSAGDVDKITSSTFAGVLTCPTPPPDIP